MNHMASDVFSIREEGNGITVYEKPVHLFTFYEGLCLSDITEKVVPFTDENLRTFLSQHQDKKTQNVQSTYPFYIGWQLAGRCNLDCIYCFAQTHFDSKKETKDILTTAEHILKLRPLSVGLSGGEPTLNPYLPDIMKLFMGKVSTVLNTNGTTKQLEALIPLMRQSGTLVRLTIDTFDNDLLNTLRPPVSMPKGGYDQITTIKRNTKLLLEADIPFMVHTVITRKNIGTTDQTAQELIALGVKRWHMYKVEYSTKCKDTFHTLEVTRDEMRENHRYLVEKYGDKLEISSALADVGFRESSILLVNCEGEFFVDTVTDGLRYLGEDTKRPSLEEVMAELDYPTHTRCYLQNFWGQ